jgi:hypothetical protein
MLRLHHRVDGLGRGMLDRVGGLDGASTAACSKSMIFLIIFLSMTGLRDFAVQIL